MMPQPSKFQPNLAMHAAALLMTQQSLPVHFFQGARLAGWISELRDPNCAKFAEDWAIIAA